MAIYDILTLDNPVLREKCAQVTRINAGVHRLLDNMKDTLYAADGVGLAAPQIGVSKRVVVIDVGDGLLELINPEIIEMEGEQSGLEGCLSVPNSRGKVKRAKRVVVRSQDRNGDEFTLEGQGLLAIALQHEIDHLDGILFIDRAESVLRERNA